MRNEKLLYAVTGAFGYAGRYIATRLLNDGHRVITLTNSPRRPHPFGNRVPAFPLAFDDAAHLEASLAGVEVLYNTYWVRFNHHQFSHREAEKNTAILFSAAKKAGVKRIVHISITNPREDSPLEYFSGKARTERLLLESGVGYAILRPAVLFGGEDILINNIAWALRRFPVFPLFGDSQAYGLQPIHVEDLASLAVREGDSRENTLLDAIGPETFTYRSLVETIARGIRRWRLLVNVPPGLAYALGRVLGIFVRDTFITREEICGLMAGLLQVKARPAGHIRLSAWVVQNRETLGRRYASELARRLNRDVSYGNECCSPEGSMAA